MDNMEILNAVIRASAEESDNRIIDEIKLQRKKMETEVYESVLDDLNMLGDIVITLNKKVMDIYEKSSRILENHAFSRV